MVNQEYGTEHKETILLLHGGGLSWWNYRDAAELLQDEYHVILPILDEHAGSDRSFIRNGQKVYNYQFVLDFPYKGKCQAWHCSDLPFLLENTESVSVCDFQRSKELEKEMSDALYRFLVSGEPGWSSCGTGNIYTMYFGNTVELKENADIELADLLLQPTLKLFRENKMMI